MIDYQAIAEEGAYDPLGTVRVSEEYGVLAIYIKVSETDWRATYIDPRTREHFTPRTTLTDSVPTRYPVVFVPKSVVRQYE